MNSENQALTQRTSKTHEKWIAYIGREQYTLNESQVDIVRKASIDGFRGIIWFNGFALSIAHMQSLEQIEEYPCTPEEETERNRITTRTYEEIKDDSGRTTSYREVVHVWDKKEQKYI